MDVNVFRFLLISTMQQRKNWYEITAADLLYLLSWRYIRHRKTWVSYFLTKQNDKAFLHFSLPEELSFNLNDKKIFGPKIDKFTKINESSG